TRGGTASVSGSRHAAVIARRNKERGGSSVISAKCCNTCGGAAWAAGAEETVDMRRLPGITQSETTDVHIMVWINKPNFSPYLANFIDKTSMKEDSSGLDRIDIEILELLQRDGRMPNTRLAEAVSLSPTAVLARVQRLTRERYILGYEARLNPRKLQAGLLVFVQVLLDRSGLNVFDEFKAAVQVRPEIMECHMVAGGFDYLLKTRHADMEAYREFAGRVLWELPGVRETRSFAVMEEVKDSMKLDIRPGRLLR